MVNSALLPFPASPNVAPHTARIQSFTDLITFVPPSASPQVVFIPSRLLIKREVTEAERIKDRDVPGPVW